VPELQIVTVTGAEEIAPLAPPAAAAAAATPAPATGGAGAPAQGEPAPAYRIFTSMFTNLASTSASASASASGAPSSASSNAPMTGTPMPNFLFPQMGTSNMVPLQPGQPSTSFIFSGVQSPAVLNRQMVGSLAYLAYLCSSCPPGSHNNNAPTHRPRRKTQKGTGGGRSSMA